MGALTRTGKRLLASLPVVISWVAAFFSHADGLHLARFARLHEFGRLITVKFEELTTGLLLGTGPYRGAVCVRGTQTRQELGNLLVVAPTRGGKGLLAVSQLLTWRHSVIVNDIKGELFRETAGYRQSLGPVYVIDPTGVGNRYDPLNGRLTEDQLYSSAHHLLFQANEAEGRIFTERATVMLTLMFLAARKEGIAPFPYVRFLTRLGIEDTAARLIGASQGLVEVFL